ncbi:hypothetical protein NGTWS0302_14360 [Mycolicibacterium cyprinidarum]|uniref:Uncharacterized protein n=1 Tax=Mycolicibacterium cyprinidarum TaxID=2860311 RepID=A0ABQ4V4J5_9MYCO|nr:hypothetical protein NGTWS1702_04020 [Mycolicibacterium sp. NGTWSNA01]GJF17523.1 hypothetical protein NGTWS0302_14360 [Mycolicibacterium sp. NGTWS0302]
MSGDADVVALMNRHGQRLAIWHVVIEPEWPMGRLCGAWVDTAASSLCVQRYLLPLAGRIPDEEMAKLAADSAGVLDPDSTRDAVAHAIAELDARHKDSPTKSGAARAPVSWPRLPEPLDWAAIPDPPRGVVEADPLVRETIAVAHWVSDLATAWAGIETLRLARAHLVDGDTSPRPLPVTLR